MAKIKFNSWGRWYEGFITVDEYRKPKNTYLQLWTIEEEFGYPEPYATMTVNLNQLEDGYAYLDTNNFPQVVKIFEEYNLGTYTGMSKMSGFCIYPLYKLNMEEIRKYGEEE